MIFVLKIIAWAMFWIGVAFAGGFLALLILFALVGSARVKRETDINDKR